MVFQRASRPPEGKTKVDVRQVLRVASNPTLHAIELTTPTNSCCDRYVYTITITYSDGSTKRFSTVDGEPWPPVFRTFIRAIS
jgi:hypothetical protein